MRVQYQYSRQLNDQLLIFHQDDLMGALEGDIVKMKLNNLIRILQSAHLAGKMSQPLVIARIKKGQKDMQK